MTVNIKGVHYDISDHTRGFLAEKLGHIDPFKDHLVSVEATITKEKTQFIVEAHVHFKWGVSAHLEERGQQLYPAIENLIHKLDSKISKEKDKVKVSSHHAKESKETKEVAE